METRQVPQLIATFNALLASMSQSAEPGIGIEVNADAESGFTSAEFQQNAATRGVTLRIKTPGREEKQSLAQLDSAMGTFK